MKATLSIRTLTNAGYLQPAASYTHEQILDAAARKLIDESAVHSESQLYDALWDECDMAAGIALNSMDLSEYF